MRPARRAFSRGYVTCTPQPSTATVDTRSRRPVPMAGARALPRVDGLLLRRGVDAQRHAADDQQPGVCEVARQHPRHLAPVRRRAARADHGDRLEALQIAQALHHAPAQEQRRRRVCHLTQRHRVLVVQPRDHVRGRRCRQLRGNALWSGGQQPAERGFFAVAGRHAAGARRAHAPADLVGRERQQLVDGVALALELLQQAAAVRGQQRQPQRLLAPPRRRHAVAATRCRRLATACPRLTPAPCRGTAGSRRGASG